MSSLPRILCLHGGGVNAKVFRIQCRTIIARLESRFRFVFVDAPFPSPAHEAVVAFFGDMGPFYRWLRFEDNHPPVHGPDAAQLILDRCRAAMDADPGSGPWAAVLGFSQGAKIAASLLWAQQRQQHQQTVSVSNGDTGSAPPSATPLLPGAEFRFGVLMAGSAPIVVLDPAASPAQIPQHVADAGQLSLVFSDWPTSPEGEHVVSLPTLHVHGLQDPGIDRHKRLLETYCKPGTTRLVEWDGNHRLPIKTADVDKVADEIIRLARQTGIL